MGKESEAISMYDKVIDNSKEELPAAVPSQEQQVKEPQPEAQPSPEAQPQEKSAAGAVPDYIGEIKSQLAAINSQMAQAGSNPGAGEVGNPEVELDQAMAALREQATNGDITYAEMIEKTAPILEQRIAMQVQRQMSQEQQAQQARGAQEAFIAENPDFMQFAQSPEAEAIMRANPVLDRVSAYYAWKNQETAQMAHGIQAQLEELKAKMNNSISGAAEKQGRIAGAGAGDDLSVPNLHRGDGLSSFEGGLAALRKARAAV